MKRKFLAALLALVMVFSMIPVSASADGTIYEGNDTFYYHITDSSLANMVAEKGPAGSSSDVSQVTITFNHDYSAGGQNTFVFRNGYTIALSNVSDYVQPDDIAYLTISFVDGTSIVIPKSELSWTWVETLPRRYDLRLKTDDNTCTVTFYYQPGDTVDGSSWTEFKQVPVQTGMSLGESMPALPDEGHSVHWVAWETGSNNGTGAEFTADTVVHSDLSVYARKVTSGGGSQYHVMNPNNNLFEAVLTEYLANNSESAAQITDVNISGIAINGSKDSTNPNYLSNYWAEGNAWFYAHNVDLPGVSSEWVTTNDRVPPDDIQSITIYATVGEDNVTYTIPRNELDVRVQSDVIIEIYLRDTSEEEEVTPPAAPEKDTVIDLAGENAVAVKCTTNEEHAQVTSKLNEDSITVGDVVSIGEGEYTCTVTVEPDSYVTAYNTENPDHSLNPTSQTGEILLVSNGEEWTIAGVAPYVTFTVACQTEPEEETPTRPDDTWIANNIEVNVKCLNETHSPEQYNLEKYTSISDVAKDAEGYFFTITIDANDYVARYNSDVESTHSLDGSESIIVTVRYTEKDENDRYWVANPSSVTINVKCDSGTTDPEKPEKPTLSEDDVVAMLGTNAIAVKCIDDKHITQYHPLENTIVSLGNVTGSKETGYQCDVTVTLDIGNLSSYLAAYNEFTTPQKHSLMSTDTITRTITLKCEPNDEVDWYFPGECPIITIDVTCASGETTIPAPDDETVNNLLGKAVIIDCTNDEANHENEIFSLIEDTYQIGEVYMADGIPHCDVTITAPDKYAAQYSYNTNTNHPLAPANQGSQAITLKYVNGEWAIDDDGMVFYKVACEDTSTEPTPDPDPTPDPTPTPGPGGGDKPPYIPPVDPDDSGVSDLLNTDDHIQYLFGYPEGTFGPENNMTRAEVAQMFYNLLLDQDVTITKTFDDVPANAWYAKAVNTLASLGVVSGVGNGDFEPERSITRAEFTSIAMKFAEGKTGGTNIFSDVKSTDWFYRAVVNSTQYGWIHGYGDGTFRPNNPITRVEVTAIVNNMLGREADVDFVTEHYDELNHFSDLVVSHWGYYHIVEATNDHDYTKPSSGENWTELN